MVLRWEFDYGKGISRVEQLGCCYHFIFLYCDIAQVIYNYKLLCIDGFGNKLFETQCMIHLVQDCITHF